MSTISLKNVSLNFPIFNANKFSFRNAIVNKLGGSLAKEGKSLQIVQALKGINLEAQKGDRIGLIGHNGSGKSTLMRTIAGIYTPTSGVLKVEGTISTLFGTSIYASEEMTGDENLFLGSLIFGKNYKEAKDGMEKLREFTELGDYLNLPQRTYSEGMKVRIGFAVATNFDPDILLIDEIFGAGDKDFAKKSQEKIESLIEKSNTFLFASHSDELIKRFCNKAILMSHGEMKAFGKVDDVLKLYHEEKS
ncbi:ABC transporter ATP-binding protein [Alphaproteobacteria bacterium]|nr:ABC transporter ATP-binding protein [Alphaproteobacteria bacterium]